MLSALKLEHFRRLEKFKFDFTERSLVIGGNGSGKTSLVEAIRLISTAKSFHTSHLDEAISFGQKLFRLRAASDDETKKTVELFYGQAHAGEVENVRQIRLNSKEIGPLDLLGVFPTVLFTADDLNVVLGSPSARRRFLDGMLCQTSRSFTQAVLDLSRILRERSSLLLMIRAHRASLAELTPWDELLAQATEIIRDGRVGAVELIAATVEKLKPGQLKFKYTFEPLHFEAHRDQEIRLAQNLLGAHRDELVISYEDRLARQFASRGQARLIIGLLKIAEASFFRSQRIAPTLLLDDIISELDQDNQREIFSLMDQTDQVIATTISLPEGFNDWQRIELDA